MLRSDQDSFDEKSQQAAIALTTSVLREMRSGGDLSESRRIAGEALAEHGDDLVLSQAAMIVGLLEFASSISAKGADSAALNPVGDGTPEALLMQAVRTILWVDQATDDESPGDDQAPA